MSPKNAEVNNGIEKKLWEMADALRGSIVFAGSRMGITVLETTEGVLSGMGMRR